MAIFRTKSLVKQNIELYLNDLFLRNGLYTNVASGEIDFYGNDISVLVSSSDESFVDNTVFQSAFKNWVWELEIPSAGSGIAPPTAISGVAVDGVFYPTATGAPGFNAAFGHSIDYPNGRVIFNSPIAAGSTVQASFSYKEVLVDWANSLDNENRPVLIETSFKDNPQQTGVDIYPSRDSRTLPAVFIDFISRSSDGYELGDKSLIANLFGVFHIWSRDDFYQDIIEDILGEAQRDVILGINFNTAPQPLDEFGDKNPAFPAYNNIAAIWSEHFWKRIYLDVTEPKKDRPLFEVERSRVEFTARVYPNF